MSAVLNKTDDFRSPLFKYTRKELEYLARAENRKDIEPGMPADLMRKKFLERPPSKWPRPTAGVLGQMYRSGTPPYDEWLKKVYYRDMPQPADTQEQKVIERDALTDLEEQWKAQSVIGGPDYESMTFQQLKKECAELGIQFKRTDKKPVLIEKLRNG